MLFKMAKGEKMRPNGFKIINNEAYLNDFKLSQLAKTYQTPLYVIDEIGLRKTIIQYMNSFQGKYFQPEIVYASKAFLVPALAKLINEYQLSMDAVSIGDLYVAKQANFPMEKIVFHGNNKQTEELEFAINNQVGLIVVDNLQELKLLAKLCSHYQHYQAILIRVNPGIDAHTHEYIQTAKFTSKFGESIYDEKVIDEMLQIIQKSNYLKLQGFHAHIGSQIHEMDAYILEIDKMVNFQTNIARLYQLNLNTLNIGGGFGIKYTQDENNLTIEEMMTIISQRLDQVLCNNQIIKKVMIEPGRSIIGPSGMTLYTIAQVKHTYGGKNYLFIDGGMTDNIRPALYNAIYECDIANKMTNPKTLLVDVVGKCCESGDIIRKDVLIPEPEENDILIVYATGAYNYSMSSNYNNLLKPAVIMVGKNIQMISRKETLEDLMRLFK